MGDLSSFLYPCSVQTGSVRLIWGWCGEDGLQVKNALFQRESGLWVE